MGCEPARWPIRTLCPHVFPPGSLLIIPLRAYLDDSRNGPWVTVGGCLAPLDAWERFEPIWDQHLKDFEVPWLHMRQFNNPDPAAKPYGHLKGVNAARGTAFMAASEQIINLYAHLHPACSVRLPDLEAFNLKYGFNLDPYSLAIYGCLICLHRLHTDPIQLVIDKFDKAQSRTERALDYAATDCIEGLKVGRYSPSFPGDEDSFRTILPLQAADFVAYETCKFRADRADQIISPEVRDNPDLMRLAIRYWEMKNKPRRRKNFMALLEGSAFRPRHFTWETYDLELLRERHPNGWGEK